MCPQPLVALIKVPLILREREREREVGVEGGGGWREGRGVEGGRERASEGGRERGGEGGVVGENLRIHTLYESKVGVHAIATMYMHAKVKSPHSHGMHNATVT